MGSIILLIFLYNNPVPSRKQAGRDKGGVEILATPLERERKRWIIRLAHGTEGISSRPTRDPLRSARTRTSLCSRATCSRRSTRASATTSRRTCISAERSLTDAVFRASRRVRAVHLKKNSRDNRREKKHEGRQDYLRQYLHRG